MKKYNIVFVVAHPDDEALWVGGTLNFLNKFDFINVNLICMTGGLDEDRSKEFKKVTDILNLKNSIHIETDLVTKGGISIEDTRGKFYDSIKKLNLDNIDLIITHPMYGDEHTNENHAQLFNDMYQLSKEKNIPFGFFSFLTMPFYAMASVLHEARRLDGTHLINLFRCYGLDSYDYSNLPKPTFYMQIKSDIEVKKKLLDCYQSIDVEEHKNGYYAWDSFIEGIYFMEEKSADMIDEIIKNMELPEQSPFRNMIRS